MRFIWTGETDSGVGPQDVAPRIIGATLGKWICENKGYGISRSRCDKLSADFRISIDVMTTETTCLSSIWKTDEKIREFYEIHGREGDYKELNPGAVTYYDGMVYVNLSEIKPMIAMPFHPSNVYTIDEVNANLEDILHEVEKKALVSLDGAVDYSLQSKIVDGKLYVDQGLIADVPAVDLKISARQQTFIKRQTYRCGRIYISVYPASTLIYMESEKWSSGNDLIESGAIVKAAPADHARW